MYKRTVESMTELHKAMEALDALDKTYTVAKELVTEEECCLGIDMIRRRTLRKYPVWEITETSATLATFHTGEYNITKEYEQENKKDFRVGDLIFNVNVSSNLSENIYEAVEKIKKVLSTPLSDYVSVEISTDDAGAGR